MATNIRLIRLESETSFAPLGVLGYCLTRSKFFDPVFSQLKLPIKTVDHQPREKLLDLLVSLLASCRSINQINTRIRPDLALAKAWDRERFAEQSTLTRTLNSFGKAEVEQLRVGNEALLRQEVGIFHHDFVKDWLWLDIDLTALPISKRAEGSTKGKIGGEKTDMVASWPECMLPSTGKPCFRTSTLVTPTPTRPTFLPWIL
jgi:hypothetical protein